MSSWSIIHQHFVHSTFSFSRTAHNSIISWVDSCFSPLKTNFPFFLKIDDSFFFFVFLEWKCFNQALLLNGFVGAHSELHLLSVEGTWVGHMQRCHHSRCSYIQHLPGCPRISAYRTHSYVFSHETFLSFPLERNHGNDIL